MTGRATFASCATSWSAPSLPRTAQKYKRATSPSSCRMAHRALAHRCGSMSSSAVTSRLCYSRRNGTRVALRRCSAFRPKRCTGRFASTDSSGLRPNETTGMRILVIEDEPTLGAYIKRGIEEQRWACDLVADGESGEARATSEAYDLVILDMRLPKKSGLDV